MCHINETEIERRLKALKVNKSMGMDCVHLMVLRECSVAFTKPLVILFRVALMQNKIPSIWKRALKSSIYKKDSNVNIR